MDKHDDEHDDEVDDKQWARKYILDPLTCPEPHQECGPGSSFSNPLRRAYSVQSRPPPATFSPSSTPPASAGPIKSSVRQPLPLAQRGVPPTDRGGYFGVSEVSREKRPGLFKSLSLRRRNSVKDKRLEPLQQSRQQPPSSSLNRSNSVHTADVPETSWNRGTILTRANSTASSNGKSPVTPMAPSIDTGAAVDNGSGLRRAGSLSARFPGDMSHRPLDIIRKEHRIANRSPHLRTKQKVQPSDPIDSLDQSGPVPVPYHHDGPYDATMASRNVNKQYSPISAVKDSNREALKATPQEYITDSITKHVPLQGTAVVPPGMRDMAGRTMHYEEGSDLMREPDAPGGAYKRYDFISYRDDDLKGKGEPSSSLGPEYEGRAFRKHKAAQGSDGMAYEMLPQGDTSHKEKNAHIRERSISNAAEGEGSSTTSDIRRSNTTGKKLADGIKRRFGSLRRKDTAE